MVPAPCPWLSALATLSQPLQRHVMCQEGAEAWKHREISRRSWYEAQNTGRRVGAGYPANPASDSWSCDFKHGTCTCTPRHIPWKQHLDPGLIGVVQWFREYLAVEEIHAWLLRTTAREKEGAKIGSVCYYHLTVWPWAHHPCPILGPRLHAGQWW